MIYGTYDPKDWVVEINGMTITAIGEDGVTWEKSEANGEAKVGVLGDTIWQKTNNSLYNLTVTIMRHCPQKAQIIALFKSGDPFPVSATNKALGERFGGTMAVFEEEPSFEAGTEASDIELTLLVFDGKTESI